MANLISNECVQCRRAVGYITKGALQLPTLCVLCAGDKETMKDWGHKIDKQETPVKEVLRDYRFVLQRMDLSE